MNQEKLGLLLQIIGISLFTPVVFEMILRFLYSASTALAIRIAEIMTKSPLGGPLLADIYLQSMERLTTGEQQRKMVIQLIWATITTSFFSIALIGFLGLPVWSSSVFRWVPGWMHIIAYLVITLLVCDVLIAFIWDLFIYRTHFGQSMINSLSSSKLKILSLALRNSSKSRSLKKALTNIIFFFMYPIGGFLLTTLEFGLLVGSLSNRFRKASIVAGIIGWVTVLTGIIIQFLV